MSHRPTLRSGRKILAAWVAVLAIGAAAPCLADSAPITQAIADFLLAPARVNLKASRVVGFAPLSLELTGIVRDANGREIRPAPGLRSRLAVESPYFQINNGKRLTPILPVGTTVEGSGGLQSTDAWVRTLIIRRPGTYTFRWLVEGEDGVERVSNEVQIRVM